MYEGCLDQMYNGFAAPLWDLDETFLTATVTSYYRQYLKLFIGRHGEYVALKSIGLLGLLEELAEQAWGFRQAWHFSHSASRNSVLDGASGEEALRVAACLGGRTLAAWKRGGFRVITEARDTSLWQEMFAYLPNVEIRMEKAADSLEVAIENHAEATRILPSTVQSTNIELHILNRQRALLIGCETPAVLSEIEAQVAHARIEAAVTLLEDYAPQFAKWVGRVLTCISLIDSPAGVMRSGSGRQWSGVAEISHHCSPVAIAEMLVHEASHQYYNILLMLDDVSDGTDNRLYYSPVRKCERPMEMILLAFHAFSNVLLFYRQCRASGLSDDGFCEKNEQELLPDLAHLHATLQRVTGYTDLGNALWRPLASRVGLG